MSYGVLASKFGHVQVEQRLSRDQPAPTSPTAGVTPWGAGKVTLTWLHLTFNPSSRAHGVAPLTIALSDIQAVETSKGRLHRTVSVRTPELVLKARVSGARDFAKQVSVSAASARKRQAREPRDQA